jgi:predicted DNA-binding transcriptional regulator AlpA
MDLTSRTSPAPAAEPVADQNAPPRDRQDEIVALLRQMTGLLGQVVDFISTLGAGVEALDASQAARLCGVSVSKFRAMSDRGLCPAPVELGDRCPRWNRSELLAWLRSGAPPRSRWREMRETAIRRAG